MRRSCRSYFKQCVEAFRRAQILSAQSGSSAYGGSLPNRQFFLDLVPHTQIFILPLRRFQSCTVEFILRYEASRAVRPYTVVRPYRVFESRLWADCSLSADV